jgi:nitrogenase-stabilizing/protective protein
MNALMDSLKTLSSAEEFLAFFAVDYDPAVVAVNRLHILQRFHQYLRQVQIPADRADADVLKTCRGLLERAYRDFVHSTAVKERVFKVFRDAEGTRTVSVDSLRDALPARKRMA